METVILCGGLGKMLLPSVTLDEIARNDEELKKILNA